MNFLESFQVYGDDSWKQQLLFCFQTEQLPGGANEQLVTGNGRRRHDDDIHFVGRKLVVFISRFDDGDDPFFAAEIES